MKFGLHHSSWLESPDPAEAYEAVRASPRRSTLGAAPIWIRANGDGHVPFDPANNLIFVRFKYNGTTAG